MYNIPKPAAGTESIISYVQLGMFDLTGDLTRHNNNLSLQTQVRQSMLVYET